MSVQKKSAGETVVGRIDPDVLAFTVGQDPVLDLRHAEWACYGTAAHVAMLSRMPYEPRLFSKQECAAVLAELAAIRDRARSGDFAITAEDQDCHLAIERNLTGKLGDLGKRVHTGRSRNDQSATAIRLYARDALLGVMEETLDLCKALVAFGRKNRKIPMVGRTHLQPAMPSSVGVWATAYAEELLDTVFTVLRGAFDFVNRCPLGSAASYGVPLPIDRQMTSDLLGFSDPIHNVLAAGNSRGKTESVVVAALAQAMVTVSRLAQDLILFSMPEFGYFSMPREFCTGSSIMPQKYNPDVCELVRSKAAQVVALSTAANGILVGMPGGYNRDLQDTKAILMEAFDTTRATLRILGRLVGGLEAHPEKLRAAFADPGVFATDRALELVASGVPFRDAYHQVRDHLHDLRGMDPDVALARKTHLGAPAGLDFTIYTDAISNARDALRKNRRTIDSALAKLLPSRPLPQ
jgi:argininosuccinate lyase